MKAIIKQQLIINQINFGPNYPYSTDKQFLCIWKGVDILLPKLIS